jgi:hypothetical protein
MNVPNLNITKFVDKDGYLTADAQLMFTTLFNEMQTYLSNEGLLFPSQTTANIATITALHPPITGHPLVPNGLTWYNSSTNQFQGLVNEVVKTFTVT